MMLRVPGREQAHLLRLGEAVEVGDLGEAGGRRLLEQAVEPGERRIRGRSRSAARAEW